MLDFGKGYHHIKSKQNFFVLLQKKFKKILLKIQFTVSFGDSLKHLQILGVGVSNCIDEKAKVLIIFFFQPFIKTFFQENLSK